MPIYEFRCHQCGQVQEALRRLGQGPDGLACPKCHGTDLRQILSTFAAHTRGSAPATPCGAPSCASSCAANRGGGCAFE